MILAIFTGSLWGQAFYQFPVPLPGATFRVCPLQTQNPCPSPQPIYADSGLTQLISQPAQTGVTGQFGFFVAFGQYSIQIGQPYNLVYQINLGVSGAGNMSTTPAGNQFVVQPAGTSSGANIFEKIRYVDSSWNWIQTDVSGSIGNLSVAGSNTLNLAPCPRGVVATDPNLYVYIAGTGTAEPALVTGGTCTSGTASGSLSVTTLNTHSAGFTVQSATQGGYEALRDCQTTNNNNCKLVFQPTNPPASTFYTFYAPLTVLGQHIEIDGGDSATIDCQASRACFLMPTQNVGPVHIHGFRFTAKATPFPTMRAAITNTVCAGNVATITSTLNPPVGTVVDIQQTFNPFYWGPHVVATTSGSSWTYVATGCSQSSQATAGGNAYQWAFIETNGQGTQVDHISLSSPGGFLNAVMNSDVVVLNDQSFTISHVQHENGMAGCDANYCAQAVYAPGPFSPNAAVIYADHMGLSLFCTGNGFTAYSGNTVHISDSVIQGFSEWAVHAGTFKGGFGQTEVENAYTELGGCTNPNYPGSGLAKQAAAGMIVQGATGLGATIHGGEFPIGQIPQFAATGNQATTYNYWVIIKDSAGGQSAPMKAGYALVDGGAPAGSITVAWPRVQTANTTTYDILRTTGTGNTVVYPSNGGCPGGSTSACGSVATAQAQCSTAICTFTETASANTSNYATPLLVGALSSFVVNFWPGGLVLTNGASAKVEDLAFVTNVSPITSGLGPQLPSVFASWCNGAVPGIWASCPEGNSIGNNNTPVIGTLFQDGPQVGGAPGGSQNIKGRINILHPYASSLYPEHLITLVDSNPTKTLASAILRPSNDANDCYIGLDNGSVNFSSAQLSFGCPVAISNYIGNAGDNTSWKERLDGTYKRFQTPLALVEQAAPSGAANNDVCYGDSTAHVIKCSYNNGSFFRLPQMVGQGVLSLGTAAISSGTCATTVTSAATGTSTSSIVNWSFASDPNGVTGYAGSATGAVLQVYAFPTTNQVNFRVCNNTSGSITPAGISINWMVVHD